MELSLAEELLLLGLDAESGEIILSVSTALPYGVIGAILLELHFRKKIEIYNNSIKVLDPSKLGDDILDEVLELMNNHNKTEEAKYWIRTINSTIEDIIERLIVSLINKGILRKECKKILWIIPVERFPAKDVLPEVRTRLLIRSVVLENAEPDCRTKALLSLIKSTNLIDELFLKDERKQANNIINEYISADCIGNAILEINAEVSSIIASSVAGTVAAASVVGSF